jgi:nucleoid-associated protein YgaU
MIDRYINRTIFKNSQEMYENTFLDRNVNYINQYETPIFSAITSEQYKKIKIVEHVWSVGDRYYKLASKYYGDPKDWWIIAKFNNKPTESHIALGDVILIPTPLQVIVNYIK